MATTQIPTQLWAAGAHNLGPVSKPAGARLVSFQVAAHPTTDWQSGAAGRTVDLAVQFSTDGGATWKPRAQGALTTPQMGHAGALPTLLEVDVSGDATGTQYRGVATFSADMTTGWDLSIN